MEPGREPSPEQHIQRPSKRGFLPPEIIELLAPPITVASWSGAAGAVAGIAGAIARDTNPVASGVLSGFQWFTLGGTYWLTRSVAIRSWGGEDQLRPSDRVIASAAGGSATGAVAGLIRGPVRILPAMVIWGALGAGGQLVANGISKGEPKAKGGEDDSWLRSKWSPLRKITDQEYIDMLEEKILKVEVDIALIDDRIAELRADSSTESESSKPSTR